MYAKLFASLYQGTLRGQSNAILVFTNLLAHCDKEGFVDKHFRAIADETGLSIDQVKDAITLLESPDPESRSPDSNGRRIERIDDHRCWGWRVVNYLKYRAIRDEETRREKNREAQRRHREKVGCHTVSSPVITGHRESPLSAHAEGEGEAEVDAKADPSSTPEFQSTPVVALGETKRPRATATDGEWLAGLKGNPAYTGIDVDRELGKAQAWCEANGKQLSRKRFVNWLNRADKPINGNHSSGNSAGRHGAYRPDVDPALAARLNGGGDTWEEAERPAAVA